MWAEKDEDMDCIQLRTESKKNHFTALVFGCCGRTRWVLLLAKLMLEEFDVEILRVLLNFCYFFFVIFMYSGEFLI